MICGLWWTVPSMRRTIVVLRHRQPLLWMLARNEGGGGALKRTKGFILCRWWGASGLSGGSGWLCPRLRTAGRCRRTYRTSEPYWSPPGRDGRRLDRKWKRRREISHGGGNAESVKTKTISKRSLNEPPELEKISSNIKIWPPAPKICCLLVWGRGFASLYCVFYGEKVLWFSSISDVLRWTEEKLADANCSRIEGKASLTTVVQYRGGLSSFQMMRFTCCWSTANWC